MITVEKDYFSCKILKESKEKFHVKHLKSNQSLSVATLRDAYFSARLLDLHYRIIDFIDWV